MEALHPESEIDLARRFAAVSPGLVLLLAAFAFGNACWNTYRLTLTIFGAVLTVSSFWHWAIADVVERHYREAPAYWSRRLRSALYFSAASWAAVGCWAGLTQLSGGYFLYIVLTALAACFARALLVSDAIVAERCLTLLLAPIVPMEIAHGWLHFEPYGYVLAGLAALELILLVAIAYSRSGDYWKRMSKQQEFSTAVRDEISREIGIPLKGIAGLIAMVLEAELTGQQREYLEIARERVQGLTSHGLPLVNETSEVSATPGDRRQPAPMEQRQAAKAPH